MADTAAAPLFRLGYRSQLTIAPEDRKAEIEEILEASRQKNVDKDITGALLVWQDYVVQTLEGEEGAVRGPDTREADPVIGAMRGYARGESAFT